MVNEEVEYEKLSDEEELRSQNSRAITLPLICNMAKNNGRSSPPAQA
jgi:hypothetical protein